ncbi:MAG: hypothetical protein H8E14_04345 [Candidatus Marinimicrobia bacterium]|nr:hypothetical protein [Candidatus Neomarinimicrobiota bacterium]
MMSNIHLLMIFLMFTALYSGCELSEGQSAIEYPFSVLPDGLDSDVNDYYHFKIDPLIPGNRYPNRIKLLAYTGNPNYQKILWQGSHYWSLADTVGYIIQRGLNSDLVYVNYDTTYITGFNGFLVPVVNSVSYTFLNHYEYEDGTAITWAAFPGRLTGDTITIWATYFDDFEDRVYLDSCQIVLDNKY